MAPRVPCVVLVAAALVACSSSQRPAAGGEGAVASADNQAAAPPAPPAPCETVHAADAEALCAAWEERRRADEPSLTLSSCEVQPAEGDQSETGILLALYFVAGQSRGDRYLVRTGPDGLTLVGDLSEMFLGERSDEWIGVRSQETVDLDGDGRPEIRLMGGVGGQGPEGECLWSDQQQLWTVICGARGPGYACTREELSYVRTVEMNGGVNPMSSQYNYGLADRCRAQVEALGLTADGPDRTKVAEQREARVDVRDGRIRVHDASGSRDESLADRIAAAACPTGL